MLEFLFSRPNPPNGSRDNSLFFVRVAFWMFRWLFFSGGQGKPGEVPPGHLQPATSAIDEQQDCEVHQVLDHFLVHLHCQIRRGDIQRVSRAAGAWVREMVGGWRGGGREGEREGGGGRRGSLAS